MKKSVAKELMIADLEEKVRTLEAHIQVMEQEKTPLNESIAKGKSIFYAMSSCSLFQDPFFPGEKSFSEDLLNLQNEKSDWLKEKKALDKEILTLNEQSMKMELKSLEDTAKQADLQERLTEKEAEVCRTDSY